MNFGATNCRATNRGNYPGRTPSYRVQMENVIDEFTSNGARVASEFKARLAFASDLAIWGPRITCVILLSWMSGLAIGFQAAVAILTAVGFVVATLFIARPSVGMLGIGMLCATDTVTRGLLMHGGGLLRYNTFNYFLLIAIVLHLPLVLRLQGFQIRILQLFLVVATVGLLLNPTKSGIAQLLVLTSPWGLLAYCIAGYRDEHKGGELWYWLAIVNGTLAAFGGLVYYLQQSGLPYVDNNEFSYFPLTAIFSICLAQVRPKRTSQRHVPLVCLAAVNLCWVFLSGSRGGILVAVVCTTFLFVQTSGMRRRAITASVVVIAGLATIACFPELNERSRDRVERLVDPTLSYRERTSGRSTLVTDGWQLFLDHPLGVGTGGFASARLDAKNLDRSRRKAAHSGWLKTLVENGLPGVSLFGLFVFSFTLVPWLQRDSQVFPFGLFVSATLAVAYISCEFSNRGLWLLGAAALTLLAGHAPDNALQRRPSEGCSLAPAKRRSS